MTPDLGTLTRRRRCLDRLAQHYGSFDRMPRPLLADLARAVHQEVTARIQLEAEVLTSLPEKVSGQHLGCWGVDHLPRLTP